MTTLIGCRCKSGNIVSRALLIGRGLFLIEICLQISKGYRWKRKLVSYVISSVLANRIRWWQIVRIPPVPIPNTVVKTSRANNTWRVASWEDRSLPIPIFIKETQNEILGLFCYLFSVQRFPAPTMFQRFVVFLEDCFFVGLKPDLLTLKLLYKYKKRIKY